MAFGWKLWNIKKESFKNEYITLGGGGLMFLIFSLSKFQLPHYLNILFPLFSIITAQYILQLTKESVLSFVRWVQYVMIFLMIIVMILFLVFYRPEQYIVAITICAATATSCLLFFNKEIFIGIIGKSFIAATGVFLFLNTCIYPSLMQYQSGSVAAEYVNEKFSGISTASMFNLNSYSFTFYTKANMFFGNTEQLKAKAKAAPIIIYTNKEGLDSLRKAGFSTNIPKTFGFFHTSELTREFINYKSRTSKLTQHYVVKVTYHQP